MCAQQKSRQWILCSFKVFYPTVLQLSNSSECFEPKALGSLGYQCIHQRILSASSSTTAQNTCFAAALIIITFGIPPAVLGAAAASTSNNTFYVFG